MSEWLSEEKRSKQTVVRRNRKTRSPACRRRKEEQTERQSIMKWGRVVGKDIEWKRSVDEQTNGRTN